MNSLRLEKKEILEYQKNRDPYLLIDVAEEVIPGVSAKGYKNLTKNDWFFVLWWGVVVVWFLYGIYNFYLRFNEDS